jgi:hypothetical protein
MVYKFNIKLTDTNSLKTPYDYIHNLVSEFINKISGYMQIHGYRLINKMNDGGNPITENDSGRNSWTTFDEAVKVKNYCYDFWIYKNNTLSRAYRITANHKSISAKILIGVCKSAPEVKFDNFWRGFNICSDGRAYLFGDYRQKIISGAASIRRNAKLPAWNDAQNVFNCKITVNDDMVLVHGKLQSDGNLEYLPGNYLSLVKCLHLHKPYNADSENRFVFLANGIYGYNDKKCDVAPTITQKKLPDGNYANLGVQLKIRNDRNSAFEYGSHRVMIFPKVKDPIAAPDTEPYKVYFEDIYGTDGKWFGLLDTVSGITTNLCLFVDD